MRQIGLGPYMARCEIIGIITTDYIGPYFVRCEFVGTGTTNRLGAYVVRCDFYVPNQRIGLGSCG